MIYDVKSDFTGSMDILCPNPKHFLDKTTTKNDKVDKEKDTENIFSHFREISQRWEKNCNKQT